MSCALIRCCRSTPNPLVVRVSAAIDLTAAVALVVIGALALRHHLHGVGVPGAWGCVGGGAGLILCDFGAIWLSSSESEEVKPVVQVPIIVPPPHEPQPQLRASDQDQQFLRDLLFYPSRLFADSDSHDTPLREFPHVTECHCNPLRTCRNISETQLSLREEFELKLVEQTAEGCRGRAILNVCAFGAGGGFQEMRIAALLLQEGFTQINLILVDRLYTEEWSEQRFELEQIAQRITAASPDTCINLVMRKSLSEMLHEPDVLFFTDVARTTPPPTLPEHLSRLKVYGYFTNNEGEIINSPTGGFCIARHSREITSPNREYRWKAHYQYDENNPKWRIREYRR